MKKLLFIICIAFFNTVASYADDVYGDDVLDVQYYIVNLWNDKDYPHDEYDEYKEGFIIFSLGGESNNFVLKITVCDSNGFQIKSAYCPTEIIFNDKICIFIPNVTYDEEIMDRKNAMRLYTDGNKDALIEFGIVGPKHIYSDYQGDVEIVYLDKSTGENFLMYLPSDSWDFIKDCIDAFTRDWKEVN